MSIATDLIFENGTYTLLRYTPQGSDRIDPASTAAAPSLMSIKHEVLGRNGDAVDRHLVKMTKTVIDAQGVPRVVTFNLTVLVPRSASITAVHTHALATNMAEVLIGAGSIEQPSYTLFDQLLLGLS